MSSVTLWRPDLETRKNQLCIAGVGDWVVSATPDSTLVTYALGSCIGVAAYDPQARVGGLLHFMLPDSKINAYKASILPATFCDTGLDRLFNDLAHLGAVQRRLRLYLVGAAKVLNTGDFFDIGKRNQLAAKRKLWELGLLIEDEDLGGEMSRTLKLHMESGRVTVRDSFGERELGHKNYSRS